MRNQKSFFYQQSQDTNDVLALTLVYRKARMRGTDHRTKNIVVLGVNVDQIHARRGHHGIARSHALHPDHPLQHDAGIGIDHIVILGLGQSFDQLIGRIRAWVDEFNHLL